MYWFAWSCSSRLASQVTLDAHFEKDLGLNILDRVELLLIFEDHFCKFFSRVLRPRVSLHTPENYSASQVGKHTHTHARTHAKLQGSVSFNYFCELSDIFLNLT